MKLLITGASGFVGQFLQSALQKNHQTLAISRQRAEHLLSGSEDIIRYEHADALIHLAGRAHVMHEKIPDIYQAYKEVNVDYSLKVATLAHFLGISRFVYLSSVKVNGEASNVPYSENDSPEPLDVYGQTKLEAELLLKDYCAKHQIELVIIRPPLIYGPNVKGNFKSLIKLSQLPIPLPFGKVVNKRSLISLHNLCSFIEECCHHPRAANQIFLVSDDDDVSTTTLIRTIRKSLGIPSLLIPTPQSWLVFFLNLVGKKTLATRLCGNLQVDISKAKNLLGWKPPYTFAQGIQRTIQENKSA